MQSKAFKAHFSSSSSYIHLNNSGQALLPDVYRDCARGWLDRFSIEGAHCALEAWAKTEDVRAQFAQFLGATREELAFFHTTAAALSQIALAIPFKEGEEILTWDQEYPSNFYPWRVAAERSRARLIPVASENWQTPVQKILDQVNAKTRAIAVSWVQYQSGAVTDLTSLAAALHGRGIWLVADVIQGAGVRPFHFADSGFDAVCGGSHKFMCSGYGAGFMICKKERLHELAPLQVGAITYGTPESEKSFSTPQKSDASKFEPGSKSIIEILALGATLQLFNAFGIDNIYAEANRLADRLRTGLAAKGYKHVSPQGPIVTFAAKDLESLCKKFDAAKISYARRGPGVRLSTHAYNRDEDIDCALDLL